MLLFQGQVLELKLFLVLKQRHVNLGVSFGRRLADAEQFIRLEILMADVGNKFVLVQLFVDLTLLERTLLLAPTITLEDILAK